MEMRYLIVLYWMHFNFLSNEAWIFSDVNVLNVDENHHTYEMGLEIPDQDIEAANY